MTRTGRCLCGKITWATDAPDLWAGHCHCDSCRRATSSPMTSFFGVQRGSVTWTGTLATYASSPAVTRGYCAACGSQMYYETTKLPAETHLYAATLDDPANSRPQAHYHFTERVPWLDITDDLPRHAASST